MLFYFIFLKCFPIMSLYNTFLSFSQGWDIGELQSVVQSGFQGKISPIMKDPFSR